MAVKEWTTVYPIGIDGLSEMPTLINDEDDALVSQAVSLRDIVIQLEEYVGTETPSSGTLRGRVANLETISGTTFTHDLSGDAHNSTTLASLNLKISDATLDDIAGTRTPTAHAPSHTSIGADPIKLDDLAAPDDNTDLDASTGTHGLLPKLSNVSTEYMNGVGAWSTPAGGEGEASPLTTKGDLYGYTTSGTRIPVGTDG